MYEGGEGFVVAWAQSQGGSSFAAAYQRFNADGSKDGNEVLISTTDDPQDTIVLTATEGNGFNIYVGKTGETFLVNNSLNKAPTSISLDTTTVDENDIGGHIANITGFDPDDDSLTYSVLSGQDSGLVGG